MKIIFNDASELQVQSVSVSDGKMVVKTILTSLDQLQAKFGDTFAVKKMDVWEQGKKIAEYDDYTKLYRLEEYPGGIRAVIMYQEAQTPEAQKDVLNAAILVAQMQAQSLTDEQALSVQSIYPVWDGNGVVYTADYKVMYNGTLYKCLQAHTSQTDWAPDAAASLWSKVLIPDPETIPEWEQPDSTNPYSMGDKVTHNGKTWESIVNNNVWEPGITGTESLWNEVS